MALSGRILLLDAVLQHHLYPATFQRPSEEELDQLAVGWAVKLGFVDRLEQFPIERLWVEVLKITGPVIHGRVESTPSVYNFLVRYGTELDFRRNHILTYNRKGFVE